MGLFSSDFRTDIYSTTMEESWGGRKSISMSQFIEDESLFLRQAESSSLGMNMMSVAWIGQSWFYVLG